MINRKRVGLAGLTLCGLLGSPAMGRNLTNEKLGLFAVPKLASPPVIDGVIDPAEWHGALALSGLAQQNPGGNLLIMRPTTFYLGWDDANIYLACRTWIMPGFKPRVGGRAHNTATAAAQNLTLEVDLNALGLVPELVWQEFIRVEPFHGASARLDFHARKLNVGNIPPGEVRWIGLRRY